MAAAITTSACVIRYATQSDVPDVLTLLHSLSSPPTPTEFTKGYARTIIVSPSESPAMAAGIAVYFPNYSTWTGPGIYIEDMIITSSQRGRGYGKALLSALAREVGGAGDVEGVNEYGMGRLQWSVLKWNKPSIDLLLSDTVGAFIKEEYLGCQVEGGKLVKLAGKWWRSRRRRELMQRRLMEP